MAQKLPPDLERSMKAKKRFIDPLVTSRAGRNAIKIEWPSWDKMVNEHFLPLVTNENRYLILYGGRGSSKSNFVAKLLIYRCLTEPYFRYIISRKYYTSIRNSQFKTLKDLIETMGLSPLFQFTTQPFEIRCKNGNMFIAAGCDEPQKIKSIKDPTGVWYEEDVIEEGDWITITTSIRTTKARFLQEIFTINPEVEGDYRENWFFKRFFKEWWRDTGDKKLSNHAFTDIQLPADGAGKIRLRYTVHHSDHTHNKWLPDEFRAFLEDMKVKNPYYYTIYCLGHWGNKLVGGRFYPEFDKLRHTMDKKYNKEKSLHISFDFNVKPYMTLIIGQVYGTSLHVIDEIAAKEPDNSTPAICRLFARRYSGHVGRVYVYGDPSGRNQDTRMEQGSNQYSIIKKHLSQFRVSTRIDSKAPGVEMRGDFINEVFKGNYGGLRIVINDKCTNMTDDLLYTLKAADGTKHKARIKDKDSGVSYESRGHFSDALDYMLCRLFKSEWSAYKRGYKMHQPFNYELGRSAPFSEEFHRW